MSLRPSLVRMLLLVVLAVPACDATGDDPGELFTDPPFGEEPAGEADGGGPMPVEADGGIGGEGGGPVTSNVILSAERTEVRGSCLVAEEPPTYRLDLAPAGTLTVVSDVQGATLQLELDGTTYTSPEDEPPAVTASGRAVAVQGRAVSDAGDEHFVDAVIGLDDLPDC